MTTNNSDLKISVVIGTFNRASLLKNVLESMINQSLNKNKFEIIIINDGSTDKTEEVVRQYMDQLPLKYFYQKNAGLSSARNHGIFAANGDVLIFLDDDDILSPNFLEKHLESHIKYPAENYAVLNYTTWDPKIKITPLMHYITDVGGFLFSYYRLKNRDVLDYTNFWGGRISCKRNFLLKYGVFNSTFKFGCEDIELGYRLSKKNLKVIYNNHAVSFMKRPISFDDFIKRSYKQGRSQYIFSCFHNTPEICQYTEVIDAEGIWNDTFSFYEAKIKSARRLDEMANLRIKMGLEIDDSFRKLLYDSYFWAIRATKIKGIIDQKNNRDADNYKKSVQEKARELPKLSQIDQNENKIEFSEAIKNSEKDNSVTDQLILQKDREIFYLKKIIEQKDQEIIFMKSSIFWKIGRKFNDLKNKLNVSLKSHSKFQKIIIILNIKILRRGKIIKIKNTKWPEGKPLVSVVIPCFNYGQYVEEAIDSAINQTFKNLEIIVIEGGSTDNTTRNILKNLKKSKTRIYFREGKHLVGDNRNYGIELAQGKYICCLDADDILEKKYIERALYFLETQKFDVVYPSVQLFGNSDLIWHAEPVNFENSLIHNRVPPSAVMTKDVWRKSGGYKDWPVGDDYIPEDWEFWTRLLGMGFRFKNINEILARYRVHNEGIMSKCTTSIEKQREVIRAENNIYFDKKYKKIRNYNKRNIYKVYNSKINL